MPILPGAAYGAARFSQWAAEKLGGSEKAGRIAGFGAAIVCAGVDPYGCCAYAGALGVDIASDGEHGFKQLDKAAAGVAALAVGGEAYRHEFGGSKGSA